MKSGFFSSLLLSNVSVYRVSILLNLNRARIRGWVYVVNDAHFVDRN